MKWFGFQITEGRHSDARSSQPFFSPENDRDNGHCLLCSQSLGANEKSVKIGKRVWSTLKENSADLATINIPVHEKQHPFKEVHSKMNDEDVASSRQTHASCNTVFRNNCERFRKKYGTLDEVADTEMIDYDDASLSPVKKRTRSNTVYLQTKLRCFVCDTQRNIDGNSYNEGGPGRCSIETTAEKLLARKKDVEILSEEQGLEYPVISHSSTLKRRLIQEITIFASSHLASIYLYTQLMSVHVNTL
eukprot:gene3928-4478_t